MNETFKQYELLEFFKLINYEEILDNFTEVKKINEINSELTDTQKKILLSPVVERMFLLLK